MLELTTADMLVLLPQSVIVVLILNLWFTIALKTGITTAHDDAGQNILHQNYH